MGYDEVEGELRRIVISISVPLKDKDVRPFGVVGPSLTFDPDCGAVEEEHPAS